jgi:beta-galactosidase
MAQRMAARMAAVVRKLDSKRFLISAELLDFEGSISPAYLDVFDVIGVNYPESPLMGKGLDNIKKKFPNKPIMSTESASYFSTRGVYEDNFERCHTSNYGSCFFHDSSEPFLRMHPEPEERHTLRHGNGFLKTLVYGRKLFVDCF